MAEGSEAQINPCLYSKFKARLGYIVGSGSGDRDGGVAQLAYGSQRPTLGHLCGSKTMSLSHLYRSSVTQQKA